MYKILLPVVASAIVFCLFAISPLTEAKEPVPGEMKIPVPRSGCVIRQVDQFIQSWPCTGPYYNATVVCDYGETYHVQVDCTGHITEECRVKTRGAGPSATVATPFTIPQMQLNALDYSNQTPGAYIGTAGVNANGDSLDFYNPTANCIPCNDAGDVALEAYATLH